MFYARNVTSKSQTILAASESPNEKQLPIDWEAPRDGVYAHHAFIRRDGDMVQVCFYQMSPPPIVGDEQERSRLFESIERIPAQCVANVFMSASQFAALSDAIKSSNE